MSDFARPSIVCDVVTSEVAGKTQVRLFGFTALLIGHRLYRMLNGTHPAKNGIGIFMRWLREVIVMHTQKDVVIKIHNDTYRDVLLYPTYFVACPGYET